MTNAPKSEHPFSKRTLHGRQKGHRLSARQQALVETRLPDLTIDTSRKFHAADYFNRESDLWLEIGFGGGEHLACMAKEHPDVNFIGCEPFLNGIAKLLVAIEENEMSNIRVYNDDARHLLSRLPPASLSHVFILYPDPWPKKRHHKRRFISKETLDLLANTMQPGAKLLIASDIPDYIRWILIEITRSDQFDWFPSSPGDWQNPPDNWPGTRYEEKAIRAGRTPVYLSIRRK